jgi:hypothetical protein
MMAASNLIALLGPGTVGAVVGGMIWKGAAWLNKNASPQAKRDVSDFVLNYEKRVDLTFVTRHRLKSLIEFTAQDIRLGSAFGGPW